MSSSFRQPGNHSGDAPYTDDEIDHLLGGGRLGGAQRERIFEAAVTAADRPGPRGSIVANTRVRALAAIALAAAAVVLMVRRHRTFDDTRLGDRDEPAFRDKGAAQRSPTAAPTIDIDAECLHAPSGSCPRGAVIVFSVEGAPDGAFMTSVLDPMDRPTTAGPVWLSRNQPVTKVGAASAPGMLTYGARVPSDQAAGAYRIDVLITRRPLVREEMARPVPPDLLARAHFDVSVPP